MENKAIISQEILFCDQLNSIQTMDDYKPVFLLLSAYSELGWGGREEIIPISYLLWTQGKKNIYIKIFSDLGTQSTFIYQKANI